VRESVPAAGLIYLEPDITRGETLSGPRRALEAPLRYRAASRCFARDARGPSQGESHAWAERAIVGCR
jgi:hypothetical protein